MRSAAANCAFENGYWTRTLHLGTRRDVFCKMTTRECMRDVILQCKN
jgi:hypothetical protein